LQVVLVKNGSDYTYTPAKMHVHWYLIALHHWATHSVFLEYQCTGRLGTWAEPHRDDKAGKDDQFYNMKFD